MVRVLTLRCGLVRAARNAASQNARMGVRRTRNRHQARPLGTVQALSVGVALVTGWKGYGPAGIRLNPCDRTRSQRTKFRLRSGGVMESDDSRAGNRP